MTTDTIQDATIAEIVASDYRTAEIFKKHGIDFCCGGKKSIARVCAEKNISVNLLEYEISSLQNQPKDNEHNFNEWQPSFLIDYIVNIHHSYVKKNLPLITEFAEKVTKVHGEHSPELSEILKIWKQVVTEFTGHMQREELVLFPFIKKMELVKLGETQFSPSVFGTVKNPVRMMETEHETAGNLMRRIGELSSEFTPPEYACNTYRVLYAKLKEFEEDLHTHVHLENNILFPEAELLEVEIMKK